MLMTVVTTNVDDTTFTSELQNVTIILPFMSKVFDNINVQKCFKDAYEEHVRQSVGNTEQLRRLRWEGRDGRKSGCQRRVVGR